jgi:hypothetical protein
MGYSPQVYLNFISANIDSNPQEECMRSNESNKRAATETERIQLEPDSVFESIATRAYFIYLNSAAGNGKDLEHWLTAEEQTNSERRRRKL